MAIYRYGRWDDSQEPFPPSVDDLMDSLKKSSDEKEKLMQQIKAGESEKSAKADQTPVGSDNTSDEDRDLSEWEKRLEGMN